MTRMIILALAAFLCCSPTPTVTATFWGDWGDVQYCPSPIRPQLAHVIGFTLKTQRPQGDGDDTALNGIALRCSDKGSMTSTVGPWGDWGNEFRCQSGSRITSCQLQVESPQGTGDDTAANNLNCRCSNGEILEGDGTSWGEWNGWSDTCDNGICAIQTRVEEPQGEGGDNTALNDVRFICCPQ